MVDLEIAHPHNIPYRTRQYYGPDYGDRYVEFHALIVVILHLSSSIILCKVAVRHTLAVQRRS